MKNSIYHIEMLDLLWMLIPVGISAFFYIQWTTDRTTIPYALVRMVLQLLLIGYLLTYIFSSDASVLVMLILAVMLTAASVISLRPLQQKKKKLYLRAFLSIAAGGLLTLATVVLGVLKLDPWYTPRFLIPLAGMIFANAMNAVSIAAERMESEQERRAAFTTARAAAYKAALIPMINALFAVGLVSLPGMMTGQIISGVNPLIAVRYQMMVMLMILGSAGISVAIYLKLSEGKI